MNCISAAKPFWEYMVTWIGALTVALACVYAARQFLRSRKLLSLGIVSLIAGASLFVFVTVLVNTITFLTLILSHAPHCR